MCPRKPTSASFPTVRSRTCVTMARKTTVSPVKHRLLSLRWAATVGMLTLLWVDGKEAILGISTKLLLMLLQGTLFPIGPRLTAMMLRILVSAPTAHDGLNARKRANGLRRRRLLPESSLSRLRRCSCRFWATEIDCFERRKICAMY